MSEYLDMGVVAAIVAVAVVYAYRRLFGKKSGCGCGCGSECAGGGDCCGAGGDILKPMTKDRDTDNG
jgi:hypothetical protein